MEQTKEVIANFLKPRGLELNEEKTEIVPIEQGVNILGYNIREYPDISRTKNPRKSFKRGIVLSKPTKVSIENFKSKIKQKLRTFKKATASQLIRELNPIIQG